MKPPEHMTEAERVIRRISELRDLADQLSEAGRAAGLHNAPSRHTYVYEDGRRHPLRILREVPDPTAPPER